ncbi:putative receptor-like protein 8 [Cryptomeria japonica]|uniref:putative receptor-like protein 8 n=1 Tax=Cryptomeria japonica TaxID=3369 RepID=UPI0027DA0517|nr:putative receptor-like protein 8 [Cryptomeria japonica]
MAIAPIKFAFTSTVYTILFTNPSFSLFNCPTQESQALLSFKTALNVSDGNLSSWVNGSDTCSKWDGISCDNLTNHVERVNLTAYTNHEGQGVQSGVISATLCKLPFLKYLNLRSIGLTGNIPSLFDVSKNALTGYVPSLWPPYLQLLMVNDNALVGTIPPSLCNLDHLVKLDLANNKLNGNIPPCFSNYKAIQVLNLGGNSLEGSRPHGLCCSSLIVRYNKLSGAFPPSITDCKRLQVLDIGHNRFAGEIPWSVGNLSALQVFMMKSNHFRGRIPSEIVQLKKLQILDLSSNNISGFIPRNISSLQAMVIPRGDGHMLSTLLNPFHIFVREKGLNTYFKLGPFDTYVIRVPSHVELDMTVKGLERHYSYILSTTTYIDLSSNQLKGEFPVEFGKLKGLRFLNLSMNNLSGVIPHSLGEMSQLESLDLSSNRRFYGSIPTEIQSLTSLECLDLSNNNLSGNIPQGGQMITFDNTSYSGNPYLEGCPLPKKCSWPQFSPPLRSPNEIQDRNEGFRKKIS